MAVVGCDFSNLKLCISYDYFTAKPKSLFSDSAWIVFFKNQRSCCNYFSWLVTQFKVWYNLIVVHFFMQNVDLKSDKTLCRGNSLMRWIGSYFFSQWNDKERNHFLQNCQSSSQRGGLNWGWIYETHQLWPQGGLLIQCLAPCLVSLMSFPLFCQFL